eukprot:Rhum_TRINITY_DN18629_c0_g1::Rhum_TRINITY_DN18629_c0_g1_i1::g.167939::m.167939
MLSRQGQDQYKAGMRYLGDKDTWKAVEASEKASALLKFASATRLYEQAAEEGLSWRDAAVVGKNVMTAHWRLAQCCESGRDAVSHVRRAVLRSLTATEAAKASDDEVLALNIEKRRTEIIADTARTYLDDYGFYDVLALIPAGVQRAEAYLEVADALHKEAVRTDVDAVGYPIFSVLAKCHRPLVDARQHARGHADILQLVENMEKDINGLQGIAESERARNNGNDLLRAAVHDCEELNTEGVFAALDCFRQAGLYARRTGSVFLQEVLASREVGHLYAEVLCMRERAKAELSHCFNLALSLLGNHEAKPWYIISKRLLETLRAELEAKEESPKMKLKQTVLKDILADLDREGQKVTPTSPQEDLKAFLQYVAKTHPPACGTPFPEKAFEANAKKVLMQTISLHHTDKWLSKPLRDQVLHEAITVHLNRMYELNYK